MLPWRKCIRGDSQKVPSHAPRAAVPCLPSKRQCSKFAYNVPSHTIVQQAAARICGAALSLAMLMANGQATAEEVTLRFKASDNPSVREAQTRLVQTYGASSKFQGNGVASCTADDSCKLEYTEQHSQDSACAGADTPEVLLTTSFELHGCSFGA